MREDALALSQKLADELRTSPSEAARYAARYHALKDARWVTADGDILSQTEYDNELLFLSKKLKEYIEEHGPLEVEGKPDLYLEPRSDTKWDVQGMYHSDKLTFERMLMLGCFKGDNTIISQQRKAGNIVTGKNWEIPGQGTPALKRRPVGR